jgi:hypothetical protein
MEPQYASEKLDEAMRRLLMDDGTAWQGPWMPWHRSLRAAYPKSPGRCSRDWSGSNAMGGEERAGRGSNALPLGEEG